MFIQNLTEKYALGKNLTGKISRGKIVSGKYAFEKKMVKVAEKKSCGNGYGENFAPEKIGSENLNE